MNLLVERYIKSKDKRDFALIFRKYSDQVYRFALSRCGNIQTSQEVVSDTFFTLLDLIDKYDDRSSKFETFLFGIALNKLRQRWDKEKVNKFFSLDEEIEISWDAQVKSSKKNKEMIKKLRSALIELKPNYAQVLELRFKQFKTIEEVAAQLNISKTNVTTIQNRAINKLREILSEKRNK